MMNHADKLKQQKQQGYRRRCRSKKLAPSNSSIELIAHSGEDAPTCETGEPIELAPTLAEQSRKEHSESIPRKNPLKNLRDQTRLKRPAHRRVLTKTVPLIPSIKPKPKSGNMKEHKGKGFGEKNASED
ncbi:hypothetical protein Droror1_Dr00007771 [Drosera rotundifolia]